MIALLETGPVSVDDGSGMVSFRKPTTDPDDVEKDFDREQFSDIVRRAYDAAYSRTSDIDLDYLAGEIAARMRKNSGVEVDREELDDELYLIDKERKEFDGKTPEEKNQYHADPREYTKYF